MNGSKIIAVAFSAAACLAGYGQEPVKTALPRFKVEEISRELTIGYAVRSADLNEDAKPDLVVVDTERVVWFQNPDWQLHTLTDHAPRKDNVSLAADDIDGDGKLDFALASDWRPADTKTSGSLEWIRRGVKPDDLWTVLPIAREPTIHRIAWADFDGDGKNELIVVPLFGAGSTPPKFMEQGVRILSYAVPKDPVAGPWKAETINDELHVCHNFQATDLDGDGRLDLLVASFEGVSLLRRDTAGKWSRALIGSGNQQTGPNRGASEIKRGRLASGRDYLSTIEPWHGFQVVVYLRPLDAEGKPQPVDAGLWQRQVLDEKLQWGHAMWPVNLDDDDDQELVVGVRDSKSADDPCGVRIYDPADNGATWTETRLDPAGVAVEDLMATDLDGDGDQDIVAVGRATKNVRIYRNQLK